MGCGSGRSSPKNRVKFLCSYGGKILPRPLDGHLKYVGGETRVIAVPRDINFSELMKKLCLELDEDMILKYQVMPEDLDVLVSVRSDEDLKHMFDEHDRQENEGNPKLRAFLFPSHPPLVENQHAPMDPYTMEQRYIDAINCTFHSTPYFRLPRIVANRPSFSISACSSPQSTSPESNKVDSLHRESTLMNGNGHHSSRLPPMHKVHSSPSLCSLNTSFHQSNNINNHHPLQHYHHYHQLHRQHHPLGYLPSRPSQDSHRLAPGLSFGRYDMGRAPIAHSPSQYYSNRHNNNIGTGNSNLYGHFDEHIAYGYRTIDRSDSPPTVPRNKVVE
ncbi:hypothetical protein K2173_022227 [Erythroxylum novogranatense]|uniref:PB1 domain-containing protein n=1 Tax=Erythroxylum novogranatense TaxID=1862640 RepID=A0AAV8STJ7_9ROSI|nr:hypothetical protein K2173_022227 [Erythroxylum novogranatense]